MLWNIKVFGIVQGVGFRPFIKNLADTFFIVGTVANKGSYVEIFAQGTENNLKGFFNAITEKAPPRSAVLKIDFTEIPADKNFSTFEIIDSEHESGDIFVSPDISVCENCKRELFDKNNKRYLHPFINCTACGPRLTILKNMPYDRIRTSMNDFPMCEDCATEYFNPTSRRFDAQPICCNNCGPTLSMKISDVRKILVDGGIVAIKGIGGFHLACDAKNFSAVQKLRQNKFRPTKPFAVMFKNISAVRRECILSAEQEKFLDSPQKPIILLKKNFAGSIAKNVAPDINKIGAMLPYTPLHLLLFDYPDDIKNFPDSLVMTSGNPSGVPISIDDDDAQKNFGDFCDAILTHNRKILLRADDSVMDFGKVTLHPADAPDLPAKKNLSPRSNSSANKITVMQPSMIRRSRGYAPLPIFYSSNKNNSILAIGGELKNTFCLAKNNLYYLSPYIGDMSNLQAVEVLKNSVVRMCDLLEITPKIISCDKHPRYHTVEIAEEFAEKFSVPLVKVQHHYAHILSCMAENNFHGEVIGVSFDGTGFGDDETVWGGEFFICDEKNYIRADSITKFTQAGGDKSSRECWRNAISMMKDKNLAYKLNLADDKNISAQIFLLENNINCVTSTSAGRLFDAVSAILGICKISTYEGEAAMKLQAIAERAENFLPVNFLTTDKIFDEILIRRLNGENIFTLARFFHESLAEFIAQKIISISENTKIKTAALTGGVFQNTLLTKLTAEKLNLCGLKILLHKMIPANDGGICLGQAIFANSQMY